MRIRSRVVLMGTLLSCIAVFAGCVLANRFTYYAPTSGTTERSARLQSARHPASIEGPPDVFVLSGSGFTLRLSFVPDFFPIGMGPNIPVPLPVVPLWILWPWMPTYQDYQLMMLLDVDTADSPVTIDFREITVGVPGEKTEVAPNMLLTWNDKHDFLKASPEIRRVSRGLRREYTLYFEAPGRSSSPSARVAVHLGGLSTPAGPVTVPDIKFDFASDVILQK